MSENLFNFGGCVLKNNLFDSSKLRFIMQKLKIVSSDNNIYFYQYENKTKEYLLPYCCKLKINLRRQVLEAWGSGISKDEAAFKCTSELIERIIYRFSSPKKFRSYMGAFSKYKDLSSIEKQYPYAKNWIGTTSSGIAVYSTLRGAKENALDELVERHVVLKALAKRISPLKTNPPKIAENYELPKNINQDFYYWEGPLKRNVVITKVTIDGNKFMYAFGANKSLEVALKKAFLESSGMMIYAVNGLDENPPETSNINPDAIRNYHLYSKDKSVSDLLEGKKNQHCKIDENIKYRDIYFTKLDFPDFLGEIPPLVAVKIVSPYMQPLFFDKWKLNVINPLAISIEEQNLPRGLHVIS
jgi:hypothetical protein